MNLPYQPIFLAIANRCRGGLIPMKSVQLSRLVCWAIPLAATICFSAPLNFPWYDQAYYFGLLVVFAFLSECVVDWGQYYHVQNWKEAALMTLQGLIFLGPCAILTWVCSPKMALGILFAALLIAPAYWLAGKIPSKIKNFEQGPPLGEVFEGFLVGLAIYLGGK